MLDGRSAGPAIGAATPVDYDGIIAGAASNNSTRTMLTFWRSCNSHRRSPEAKLPPESFPLIQAAALKACDEQDGTADGSLTTPPIADSTPRCWRALPVRYMVAAKPKWELTEFDLERYVARAPMRSMARR
jgi:hypothetical protein